MTANCLVLSSGGIDSSGCLKYYQDLGYHTEGVFVDYGHPANPVEYLHVQKVCQRLGLALSKLEFRGGDPPKTGEIRGRNGFLIMSTLMARPPFAGILALGIHAASPYYDCGVQFFGLMKHLVSDYTQGTVQLDAPLMELTKPEIVEFCKSRQVPLDLTYSCESGTSPPCGSCASCGDRRVLGLL